MLKCFTCKKEIDREVDVYAVHRKRPRPSCIQCVKDASRLSYYRKKLHAREQKLEAPLHLVEHNADALKNVLRDFQGKNEMDVDLQITGGMCPFIGGLKFKRHPDGNIFLRAQVRDRVVITRNAALTTVVEFSTLLAEYRVKVIYGPA